MVSSMAVVVIAVCKTSHCSLTHSFACSSLCTSFFRSLSLSLSIIFFFVFVCAFFSGIFFLLIFSRPSQFNILLRIHSALQDDAYTSTLTYISYNQLNESTVQPVRQWHNYTLQCHRDRAGERERESVLLSVLFACSLSHAFIITHSIQLAFVFYVSASCFASLMLLSLPFVSVCVFHFILLGVGFFSLLFFSQSPSHSVAASFAISFSSFASFAFLSFVAFSFF